jgi:RNA polymerase sigma factor (sigma-70 family)
MRDRDIAASLAARDPAGLAAAYDRHAAGLYGYCRSLLGEPADAADAAQDTFIIAAAQLARLRNPARLRSWLYAIARNECQSRLRAGAWPPRADPASELAAPVAVAGTADSGQGELRYLVADALGRLSPGEREVAELSRRHGLDHADLAGVLGVPVRQAQALAVKAGAELDRSLGTLLVAGTGWGACPGLDALLDGWDGRPTVVWRTRAGRHIDGCEACGERRRKVLSPAMLRRLLPLPMLPGSLREQVLWLVPDGSTEAVSYRDEVIGRIGPFDAAGFPVQIAPAGWTGRSGRPAGAGEPPGPGARWRRRGDRPALRRLALVAALLVLVGGGSVAALVLHGGGPGRTAADSAGTRPLSVPGAPGGSADPGLPGPDPARPVPTPPSGRPPSPGASAPAARSSAPGRERPSPPASSAPARSTAPRASAPPKPKPPPPVLSESPGTVSMAESNTNIWTGSFTLTAANGPVSFSVAAPSGVAVSEAGGTVSPGSPVTIRVTYTLMFPAAFPSALTVNGITVGLSFRN